VCVCVLSVACLRVCSEGVCAHSRWRRDIAWFAHRSCVRCVGIGTLLRMWPTWLVSRIVVENPVSRVLSRRISGSWDPARAHPCRRPSIWRLRRFHTLHRALPSRWPEAGTVGSEVVAGLPAADQPCRESVAKVSAALSTRLCTHSIGRLEDSGRHTSDQAKQSEWQRNGILVKG
jgi:hypothetical protein